jgi:hypothetical protein
VKSGAARPEPGRVLEPEVLPPQARWVEKAAWLMDRAIPLGGKWSVGLDGILGLVPGVGDIVGIIVGGFIIAQAIRARIPRAAIGRMVANVAMDGLIGAVPFLGDLFDIAFKANTRNVQIFREAMAGRRAPARDSLFVAGVFLAILLVLAVPVAVLALLLRSL